MCACFAGKAETFRAFEYSASTANVFDDTNQMPLYDWHPRIQSMVYYGMDWLCPGELRVCLHIVEQQQPRRAAAHSFSRAQMLTMSGAIPMHCKRQCVGTDPYVACAVIAGYNRVLSQQLLKYHGSLTPAATINDVLPIVQTGDVHAAVYDLTDQQMYVSFYVTNSSSVPTPVNAYDRAFTQLDLLSLFAEQPPAAAIDMSFPEVE